MTRADSLATMDKGGIGLALLARFVLACQSATLQDAAAVLAQTPSALGTALRGLERQLGLQLFVRRGGGLALHPSAFWLFRGACRLLYLEQHLVTAKRTAGRPLRRLHVELDLSFAIGRFSKGLVRATQEFIASQPQVLVGWHFVGEDDNEIETALVGSGRADGLPDIRIQYGAAGDSLPPNALRLYEDPWIVVSAPGTELAPGIDREPLS
jgi:DNA-binding transcriptional LysR family regulator